MKQICLLEFYPFKNLELTSSTRLTCVFTVHTRVYVYVHICVCTHMYTHVCMYMYAHGCERVCTRTCVHVMYDPSYPQVPLTSSTTLEGHLPEFRVVSQKWYYCGYESMNVVESLWRTLAWC